MNTQQTSVPQPAQQQMNAQFHQTLQRLLNHAEHDERLARSAGDQAATATAKARRETLEATLGIYVAAHFHAYGERPWAQQQGRADG